MAELMDSDPQPLIYWDRKQFTHFQDQVREGPDPMVWRCGRGPINQIIQSVDECCLTSSA